MSNITWGPEIMVGGVRPDWLGDDAIWQWQTSKDTGWANGLVAPTEYVKVDTFRFITAIRLLKDHFAYVAISKGYTPWGGGDAAPDEWDGGDVLWASGRIGLAQNASWGHQKSWLKCGVAIIGYRKRTEMPADTVTVPRLTLDDVSEAREGYFASGLDNSALFYARRWGLLPPETLAERFTRETGHEVTPGVEAALAWERG